MQSNNIDYKKVFENCETDIAACEKEISTKEKEIEDLKIKKQGFTELKNALQKILYASTTDNTNQKDETLIEKSENIEPEVSETETQKPVFTVETPKGVVEVFCDAFVGLEMLPAIKKFLKIVNYPQKTSEIADGLAKGGFESQSIYFAENVRSALRNASKSTKGEIVWKDKLWWLGDWDSKITSFSQTAKKNTPGKRKFGSPKWSRPIADAAADILKSEKDGLHLEELHTRLAKEEIYPTMGSLDAALRQDKKERFQLVSPRTYILVKS